MALVLVSGFTGNVILYMKVPTLMPIVNTFEDVAARSDPRLICENEEGWMMRRDDKVQLMKMCIRSLRFWRDSEWIRCSDVTEEGRQASVFIFAEECGVREHSLLFQVEERSGKDVHLSLDYNTLTPVGHFPWPSVAHADVLLSSSHCPKRYALVSHRWMQNVVTPVESHPLSRRRLRPRRLLWSPNTSTALPISS